MYDPVDSSGMPLRIADSAPRFAGNYTQLVNFLESVEQLAQPLGLSDKEIIKYALKYTAPKQRQLLSYYEGDNYVEFADHVLYFYLECGVDHYTRPIFEKPATIEAPLASAPPQPECAQEQPEVEAIAPIPELEVCEPSITVQISQKRLWRDYTPPFTMTLNIHAPKRANSGASAVPEANKRRYPPTRLCPLKHPHISAPIPEPSEAPEANNAPLSDQVMSPETPSVVDTSVLIALSALSDHPQVQYPCTIPLPVSDDFKHLSVVRDDSKHPSHLNAPVAESSAVPEAQNTPPSDQSISLVTPSVTDHSAHSALSAYSDYRLLVKHPCITSPIRQLDHVLHDSDAPPARRHTPEVAQVMHLEALYIHPRSISHFSSISCLKLSRSHMPVAIISPGSPHHFIVNSSFMHRIRVSCAYTPALYAPAIAEELSCYRIFTISSVLNRISLIQNQSRFNLPSMRSLCAHYPTIEHPHAPYIAPLGRAFNLYRKVQEFIPPVTSPPSSRI
ncbi:hypothetical protein DFJ58DRAFT_729678 [Suillus subalutaceus]|uniref:uncharacterized protein n=1 Tax=Suillus subalutaceus TaxID=48586 RepID=UPI001B874AC1|nr:uncharacterized protein DFJ58DRAFT_729678 [Suillus subalutaceus]KAG1848917.1 hypothetical protein DFJ58DRAFT_729678 [Suillus subalutaceus]